MLDTHEAVASCVESRHTAARVPDTNASVFNGFSVCAASDFGRQAIDNAPVFETYTMPVTTVVQTRLAADLANRLDQRADAMGIPRTELMRRLLEVALDTPPPGSNATADPLIAEIADAVGALTAKIDACRADARSAHAAARLTGLMLLPADRQQAFIDKLTQVRS